MAFSWQSFRMVVHALFLATSVSLTVYIGFNVFGLIRNSSEHYTNFVLAVVVITGLIAIRNAIDLRIGGAEKLEFWPRLTVAILATVIASSAAVFLRVHAIRLEQILPFFEPLDIFMGLVFTLGVLLLTWIHWGPLLTLMVAAAIVYFFFGHHIESPLFTHPDYEPTFVMNYVALSTNQGFFWLAQVAADSLYFLIIYAAVLLGVGTLSMVLEVGKASGRYVSGGAAFPALIGSGIVASVMGQAVSNVVLTGRFTIPMMKANGFRPAMAGAIEAVASTSGQIMPPILGLAAFIIASFLNMPYIDVALAALIPGLLFLSGTFIGVLVYAQRYELPKLTDRADRMLILRMLPAFLFSFLAVLVLLLNYISPSLAGLVGIAIALALCLFQGRYRPSFKSFLDSLEEGFVLVALLSLLLIAIGPLGQVMITTNLSGRLGLVLIEVLPDAVLLLLFGAMVVSLVLGMGLPTPVAYVVVAVALVPFMQQIGIPALQAHFFVFYFAVFSTLTPPIAVSVLAAAKLADAHFLVTALDAMKLSLLTFIIPFAFVYNPSLMSFPDLTWDVVPPLASLLVLQTTTAISCYGHCFRRLNTVERLAFAIASVVGFAGLVDKGITVNVVFGALVAALLAWIWLRPDARTSAAVPPQQH